MSLNTHIDVIHVLGAPDGSYIGLDSSIAVITPAHTPLPHSVLTHTFSDSTTVRVPLLSQRSPGLSPPEHYIIALDYTTHYSIIWG